MRYTERSPGNHIGKFDIHRSMEADGTHLELPRNMEKVIEWHFQGDMVFKAGFLGLE